jgi:hypothetical protein
MAEERAEELRLRVRACQRGNVCNGKAVMETAYDPPLQFRTALEQLHDIVGGEVGSSDFGEPDYLPGLTVPAAVDGL